MIACGGIKSKAVGRMDQELTQSLKNWSKEQLALYGPAMKAVLERDAEIAEKGADAQKVAKVVERALRGAKPKPEYKVGLSKVLSSISSMPPAQVDDFFISMLKPEED